MRRVMQIVTILTALLASQGQAQNAATNYPSRPVNMVVPFAPGAATDIEGKLYAIELSRNLGQQFVMDYKPGAVMGVGLSYAQKQKPDGYTLVWVASTYSLLPIVAKDRPYDVYSDFDLITLMSKRSGILAVSNNMPIHNIKEYIAYVKANPGKINFATSGNGGIQHLTGLWLTSDTNTQVTFVHYKSISASHPDLMAGRTHMVPGSFSSLFPHVKAGKLRAIAIASLSRNPALPDLSTATEQGVPGFEYSSWLGLVSPKGIPAPIINKLHGELAKIIKLPGIIEKMGDDAILLALPPAEFRKASMAETARFKKLVEDNNIQFDD